MTAFEELVDYRRSVAALYAAVRESDEEPDETWRRFRRARDQLFRTHPQSALPPERRASLTGLRYFNHNSACRFVLPVETGVEPGDFEFDLADDGVLRMKRCGRIRFSIAGQDLSLTLFWLAGYGGGLFLPFRDLTSGRETYGGGRYLLDTIKHADLGRSGDRLVVDFNYAYNPSCAYDPKWVCPLAPAENWLPVRIEAGEKTYTMR